MADYFTELATNKNFIGNVIIRFLGVYISIRDADSGVTIDHDYRGLVSSLVINPTSIDPRRVATTIASYSFKLIDKNLVISKLVKEKGEDLIGESVEIWIGRTGVGMDFADYYKLPITRIKKLSRQDNGYSFSTTEETDRMNAPIYSDMSRLLGDVFSLTTTFTMKDDISGFPSSGFLKIDNEIISYTSKSDSLKQFYGLIRGEFGTLPVAHSDNDTIFICEQVTDNPLNLILRLLTSGGGGGAYDNLKDGLAISNTLIDIAGIEDLRDGSFFGRQFTLAFYNITNALQYMEKQLLEINNLRFTYSRQSKLTLALLDKAKFVDSTDVIDEDTLSDFPHWNVDESKVVNQINIDWDYNEATGKYEQLSQYADASSIATYGAKTALKFQIKGAKVALNGQAIVDSFANELLARLSFATPEIDVKTQIDKSLLNIADKTVLESSMLPDQNGALNFAEELEVINRAINYQTGDVSLKLAFTSFTGIRSCYICPSDTIALVNSQSSIDLGAGRGDLWQPGFKVKLWNNLTMAYETDPVNEIQSITADTLVFTTPFVTTLTTDHRIKFADYDSAAKSQKRYCFVGDNSLDFPDGGKRYSILP
jgi:hypothetical protein